jgi:hypothetical protein
MLLPQFLQKKFCRAAYFFLALLFLKNQGVSQTTMLPGDMAIIKFVTGSGTDNVSFLVLNEISCGTQFIFTDNNWSAGTSTWTCNDDEFAIGFTTTSILKAGTIINIEVNPIGNLSVSPFGSLTYTSLGSPWGTNVGLNSGGDNGFLLQGTRNSPSFIYGLRHAGTFASGGSCSSKDNTGLPSALTLSSTAIEMSSTQSYWQYNCSVLSSGTQAALLSAISTKTNWTTSSAAQSFTITNAPYYPSGSIGVSGAGCGCLSGCNLTSVGGPNCTGVTGNCSAGETSMSTDITVPAGCTYYVTATMRTWTTGCSSSGADSGDQLKVDIPGGPKTFQTGSSNSAMNDSYTLTGPGTIRVSGTADRADEVIVYRIITSPCSTCGTIVLPIELTQFSATPADEDVELKWTTASEHENDFYTIERSTGSGLWENISIVNSLGNSHTYTHYTILDSSPLPGLSYYRLKQTDKNGSYSYSEVVYVDRSRSPDGKVIRQMNLYGQEVDENAQGLIILLYDNGTVKKIFR